MEAVCSLKRPRQIALDKCIICQETRSNKLCNGSEKGIQTLKEAAHSRARYDDPQRRISIERINDILREDSRQQVVWHKSCYAIFTSKSHISRLHQYTETKTSSSEDEPSTFRCPPALRSSMASARWDVCMFCQDTAKGHLSAVTTFKMSEQILKASKYDPVTRVRFAGVSDLIASEGKYHTACYMQFCRNTSRTKDASVKSDVAMEWLIIELKVAAEKAHVLQMCEVFRRYCELAKIAEIDIPVSFISKLATFTAKLKPHISDVYNYISMPTQPALLVPVKIGHVPLEILLSQHQESEPSVIPQYHPPEDGFLEMVHLALKLRSDILTQPVYKGFVINEAEMRSCVPDTLLVFLRLMFGGVNVLDVDPDTTDDSDMQNDETSIQAKILSIAQDLVYNVSGGKHWTPKHVGLASTLHQATRSKDLVQLFHNAGHTISYENILQVDTSLAEKTLESMDPVTGAVTPPNFVCNRFVHFTCDNIDINDTSFDGKNSFHATQVAAWQRGPCADMQLQNLQPSTKGKLQVPEVMEQLIASPVSVGKLEPTLTTDTRREWYTEAADDNEALVTAFATDTAFFMKRHNEEGIKESWTHFNHKCSKVNPEVTSVGYMPIVQAPAHELDTLNTVVQRCKHVARRLGQHHVVLTVDEALYCKLMELKWANKDYQDFLVVRLGGLHTAMNFLKIIGKHVQSSGLLDAWTESKMLGSHTAEQVLDGKSYARAMRAHKLTIQAMWRLLMPQLFHYIENEKPSLKNELEHTVNTGEIDDLVSLLQTKEFRNVMDGFVASNENSNFRYWWSYMQMVEVLLLFTRAQRDGLWELHLSAFQAMLPFFMRYDHTNYARWGTIYINEMHQLPPDVQREFSSGNFVVKMTKQTFNQVDPDQSQEWLNGTGKKGGGIVGITKTSSALSRWALSYNLRSHLAHETHQVYSLRLDDDYVHNECTRGRQQHDGEDENNLLESLKAFSLFSTEAPTDLQNMATKDLVTKKIEDDLLQAHQKGLEQLDTFIKDRLLPCDDRKIKFRDPLPKNKPLTFASLFEVRHKDAHTGIEKSIKADRKVLQRLITAYEAGRSVNLSEVLTHELLPVPLALAEMNGSLRSGTKAILTHELTQGCSCPQHLDAAELGDDSLLIIDGQALVVAIGKPQKATTFGDLADSFAQAVFHSGVLFRRIDVVFDRYYEASIKGGTRKRRRHGLGAIRRLIESRNVPLPSKWENFLAHSENKADLARFLSQQLILLAPDDKIIVAAGGFSNEETVESSVPEMNTDDLEARHEEADTRMILHCVKASQATSIVVSARDTDVLVLLLAHFNQMSCSKVWLKTGTSTKRSYIPIHTIVAESLFTLPLLKAMPAFHALTGSDTTSFLARHSKKSCWKAFKENYDLLKCLGVGDLDDETVNNAELFICKLYNVPSTTTTVNKARAIMFVKSSALETLPPTSNALSFHIKRAHYQAAVWLQAHKNYPELPPPETMGWKLEETSLVPVLMSLPPIPQSCIELITCNCMTRCMSARCKCKKSRLSCTAACRCRTDSDTCCNE